jgi:hypothetical protein
MSFKQNRQRHQKRDPSVDRAGFVKYYFLVVVDRMRKNHSRQRYRRSLILLSRITGTGTIRYSNKANVFPPVFPCFPYGTFNFPSEFQLISQIVVIRNPLPVLALY